MTTVIFRLPEGRDIPVQGEAGTSVMQLAVANGVPGIVAECGGSMACATCHVYVEADQNGLPAVSEAEDDMLDFAAAERLAGSRLSCQLVLSAGLTEVVVRVPERQS